MRHFRTRNLTSIENGRRAFFCSIHRVFKASVDHLVRFPCGFVNKRREGKKNRQSYASTVLVIFEFDFFLLFSNSVEINLEIAIEYYDNILVVVKLSMFSGDFV